LSLIKGAELSTKDTDRTWEYYGSADPYYGVLTSDDYRRTAMTPDMKAKFFDSGRQYVDVVLGIIKAELDVSFQPKTALDFGCGVGRLVIPLAKICTQVTGVEISASMIEEAKKNCREQGISNVSIVKSDDTLSQVSGSFDLVHSYIVFQHIAPDRGETILRRLIDVLRGDGVGVLQFTYFSKNTPTRKLLMRAYKHMPFMYSFRNLLKGRPFREPLMQMNEYNLNRIFRILQDTGCHRCGIRFTDHNMYGIIIFFQKKRQDML